MTFPRIESTASSSQTTNTTTHVVSMPSGVAVGDLLISAHGMDARPSTTGDFQNNWIQVGSVSHEGDLCSVGIWRKIATGSEGSTEIYTTGDAQTSAHRTWRITGFEVSTPPAIASLQGATSATMDPPALDPAAWGTEDTLWIAISISDDGTTTITGFPSSYTGTGQVNSGDAADGITLGWALRENAVASENPGAFTLSSAEAFGTLTLGIRPAPPVAFHAIGAKSAGGTSTISVAYPTPIRAGDLAIVGRAAWDTLATADSETGWSNHTDLLGGQIVVDSADSHRILAAIDTRILDGTESGSVTFDQGGTTGGALGTMITYRKHVATTWSVTALTADDSTHAADRSSTTFGTFSLQPNDVVVAVAAVDTDTSLASFSAPAITASGITFGTTTRRTSGAGVTTGNDGNIEVFDATVTSGTATSAMTLAFTTTTNQCGPVVFVRLRAVTSSDVAATFDAPLGGTSTATATVEHPATVTSTFGGTATTTAVVEHVATLSSNFGGTATAVAVTETFATATGSLGGSGSITAVVEHPTTAVGDLGFTTGLAATPDITATFTGDLGGTGSLTTTVEHAVQLTEDFGFTGSLTATTSGEVSATLTGDLGGGAAATAVVEHVSTFTASLDGGTDVTATVEHPAVLAGAFGGGATVAATVEHIVTLTAALGGTGAVTADVEHVVTLVGDLGFTGDVAAAAEGAVNATLTVNFGGEGSATAGVEHIAVFGASGGGAASLVVETEHLVVLDASFGGASTSVVNVEHAATLTGNLGFTGDAVADVEGEVSATLAASLGGVSALTALVEHVVTAVSPLGGVGTATAEVEHPVTLVGTFDGTATLTATVTGPVVPAVLDATLTLQSSLVATAEHTAQFTTGLGGASGAVVDVSHTATSDDTLGFTATFTATTSWELDSMLGTLCEPWPYIWCGDVSVVNPAVTGDAIMAASEILWELTGRRFGNCAVTVRPCRSDCAAFPPDTRVYSHGVIASTSWGWPFPLLHNGSMINFACGICVGDCSCTIASEVILPETIYQVDQVVIDGVSLPASGYALYDGQRLVKADGEWPLCQDWTKTAGGPGVWTITAHFGAPVPILGRQAVGVLALELARLCSGLDCNLPPQVTSVTRQGVTMQRIDPRGLAELGLIGLYIPDQFIRTFNPHRLQDRVRVWSPDVVTPRVVG